MASVSRFAVGLISLALAAQASFAQELAWKHGTVAPKGDAGFLYMGAEHGFEKQAGVNITMVSLKGDAMLTKALLAGEIDSYEGNPGGPMIAAGKGADIKILGCPWPGLPYALYTKADVNSVKELKGKAIAVSDPGSLPDLFARAALRAGGLDPNKDVQYVRAGSDVDRVKALAVGVVAAAPSSIELAPRAKELGLKMLVQAKDVTPEYVRTCIMTTSKVLSTKRPAAVAFMAAQMNGLSYALAHEDETIALSNKLTNVKPDDLSAKEIFREAKNANMVDATMGLDPKKFIYLRDLLADGGLLSRTFDPAAMLDPSVRAEAAKKAGAK